MTNTKKKKILVVEDDAGLCELVKSRLEKEGFDVITAADGFQAVVTARQADLDLIILDLILPKMDGYSVCQLLKSSGVAKTPIIMFSVRSSPEDIRRGLDMGASAFVPKPYDAPVLVAKVRELLFPQEKAKAQPAAPKPAPAAVVETPAAPDTAKVEREAAERRAREQAEAKARAEAERRRQEESRKPAPPRTREELELEEEERRLAEKRARLQAEAKARADAERKRQEEEQRLAAQRAK